MKTRRNPVLDMVRKVRGTAPRIAEVCGISREAVHNWKRVPAEHVLIIEPLLNIPRHHIRPDLYPPPFVIDGIAPSGVTRAIKRRQQHSDVRRNPVLRMVRDVYGTASRIAAACGINREAVWNWHRVPAAHVLTVEQLLDIPRHRIRPDLYPPPSDPLTKRWLTNNGRRQHGARA